MKRITVSLVYLCFIGLAFYLFSKYLINNYFMSNIAGAAFWGAFFSFLFVKAGGTLERFIERKRKHYNMLVRLEYTINEYLTATSFNLSNLDGLFKSIIKTRESKIIIVQYFGLKQYKLDREILLGLQDVDLINDVFNMYVDLDYLNDNHATILEMYADMRCRYLDDIRSATETEQKLSIASVYRTHLDMLENQMKDLLRSIVEAEEILVTVLAKIRISLEKNILFKQLFYSKIKFKMDEVVVVKNKIRQEMIKCN